MVGPFVYDEGDSATVDSREHGDEIANSQCGSPAVMQIMTSGTQYMS